MRNFYIKIDSDFLNSFDAPIKEKLEYILKELSRDHPECLHFLRLCPYCNILSFLSITGTSVDKLESPSRCAFCGESNPFDKFKHSLNKVDILYGLAAFSSAGDDDSDNENERALLEQAIVALATGFEIFLKDIYCSGMNLKYIKDGQSLFFKFSAESKNDFINIGKAMSKYKNDLNIDLKKMLSDNDLKKINFLLLKRNVIVHNNGFVDIQFKNQSGIDCKIGEQIQITNEDIAMYRSILESVVEKLEDEFEAILSPEMGFRIKNLSS